MYAPPMQTATLPMAWVVGPEPGLPAQSLPCSHAQNGQSLEGVAFCNAGECLGTLGCGGGTQEDQEAGVAELAGLVKGAGARQGQHRQG